MSGVTVFLGPVFGAGVCVVGVVVVVVVAGAVVVVGCVTGALVPGRTPPAFMATGLALVPVVAGVAAVVAGAVVAVDALPAGAAVAPVAGVATLPAADCVTVPPAAPHGLAAGLFGCDFFLLKIDAMLCTAVVAWATVDAPCCAAPCTASEPVAFATAVAVPAAPPLLQG